MITPSSCSQISLWLLYLPHILATLFSLFVLSYLFSRRKTLLNKTAPPINPQTNAGDTTHGGVELGYPIRVIVDRLPPFPPEEHKAKKPRAEIWKETKYLLEFFTVFLALGLFVVTWTYTRYTYEMWCEMQAQTHISQEGQRPWIGVSKIEVADDLIYKDAGVEFKFNYVLKNVGRSPGLAVVYGKVVDVQNEKALKDFCDQKRAEMDKNGIDSNEKGSLILHVVLPELETAFYESPPQPWVIHREMVGVHEPGYIQPYNVGCVFYRFINDPPKSVHETRFYGEITLADPKGLPPPPWKSYGIKIDRLDRHKIRMKDLLVVNAFLTQTAD